jgi:threonine dehydrogenase-like Zn-dependent dehydrogenase
LTVVGVDSRKEPLALSKSLKYTADLLINSTEGTEAALKEIGKLKKNNEFPGLDAVVIATGANPAFEFGADLLKKHGTLIVVGQPPEKISFSFFQFIFRDITVKGSLLADTETCQEMVDMVAEKGIEVKTKVDPDIPLISEFQVGADQRDGGRIPPAGYERQICDNVRLAMLKNITYLFASVRRGCVPFNMRPIFLLYSRFF